MKKNTLVLASTSSYREAILKKLNIPFLVASPNFNETPLKNETPYQLVERLAIGKATSCQVEQPSLIIGSDQICIINDAIVGKSHTRENAIKQLESQSGKRITFMTSLALYNTETQRTQSAIDTVHVYFRHLTREQIETYVDKEKPFNCSGSFKCEGLGIALLKQLDCIDPNSLIGLPLIRLIDLLENEGVSVLSHHNSTKTL